MAIVNGTETLATKKVNVSEGKRYVVDFVTDPETGKADLYFYAASDKKPETPTLTVTNDSMKKIVGDIAFSSWGGKYSADNVKVLYLGEWTAESIVRPGLDNDVVTIPDTGEKDNFVNMALFVVMLSAFGLFCVSKLKKEEVL